MGSDYKSLHGWTMDWTVTMMVITMAGVAVGQIIGYFTTDPTGDLIGVVWSSIMMAVMVGNYIRVRNQWYSA